MATPLRSRYPRPLKATHNFVSSNSSSSSSLAQQTSSSSSTRGTASGERAAPAAMDSTGGEDRMEHSPRRSNSMGCLSDPNYSLWPTDSPSDQSVTDRATATDKEDGFYKVSHKRSSSCSSADRLKKTPHLKNGQVHTRTSIEGLNQEVSLVFEGKAFMPYLPPDGHVAPVRDLLDRTTASDTQTPPHVGPHPQTTPTYQRAASSAASPLLNPSPPLPPSLPSQSTNTNSAATTGTCNTHSPADNHGNMLHPSSPKPSFAREPPDGAERCTIRRYSGDFLPRGPDKSKGNIVFKGTVFGPPPLFHSLKAVSVNI